MEPDIRLIAVDMDGSLLDDEKRMHDDFWPLLDELDRRGILLCPASGRQYASLRRQLGRDDLVYIAENGALRRAARRARSAWTAGPLGTARTASDGRSATHLDLGTVLCGKRSAYVERTDDAFLDQTHAVLRAPRGVDDLLTVDDDILKVAVYDFGSAGRAPGPLLERFAALVSGKHWVDVMSPTADKGHALRAVQDPLGITADHTMAFGDYLNDVGMLDVASFSFAMDNAHPDVRAHARFVAPSNNDNGVVRTIRSVLGLV